MGILYLKKVRMLIEVVVERAVYLIKVFEQEKVCANKLPKLMGGRCAFELKVQSLQILEVKVIYHGLADPFICWFAQVHYYLVDS